jgi:hypothetical protein
MNSPAEPTDTRIGKVDEKAVNFPNAGVPFSCEFCNEGKQETRKKYQSSNSVITQENSAELRMSIYTGSLPSGHKYGIVYVKDRSRS